MYNNNNYNFNLNYDFNQLKVRSNIKDRVQIVLYIPNDDTIIHVVRRDKKYY